MQPEVATSGGVMTDITHHRVVLWIGMRDRLGASVGQSASRWILVARRRWIGWSQSTLADVS